MYVVNYRINLAQELHPVMLPNYTCACVRTYVCAHMSWVGWGGVGLSQVDTLLTFQSKIRAHYTRKICQGVQSIHCP